ncbi:hypothetical protein [Streptomyces sp. NPDC059468]|uniref:hypothetical protein n=1 Tax=Streptomyces sp. NPDC059468 TaxID=3346845 RepID=UPI00367892E2
MFMRLCTSLPLSLAAAAALVSLSPAAAHADADADASSSCAAPGGRAFPVTTRIHGGPASYEAGGGFGTWYIDLTNTTGRTCTEVHPVVVLVDDKRTLKPSQPKLDFYDGSRTRPVTFESTDEQELVGVLDGTGFDGFTVAPGATVSVRVRLSLTSDAVPDDVTVKAAVVQRRGEDGDWVGESNDYRFGIGDEPDEPVDPQESQGSGQSRGPGDPEPTATAPSGTPTATPSSTGDPDGLDDPDDFDDPHDFDDPSLPFAAEAEEAGERARELARTGLGLAHGLLAAGAALLSVGAGAFLLGRRRR